MGKEVMRIKSIAKWAVLGWIAIGTFFSVLFSFTSFPEKTWIDRAVILPRMIITWPWALYAMSHTAPIPAMQLDRNALINNVPVNLRPEIVTDLGVVRPPPPELIEPKVTKAEPPEVIIDEERR
jgi:hypothetical protein